MEGYENSVDFPLYEHQLEAVNGVDDIYSDNRRLAGVKLPTGGGKSCVAMQEILRAGGNNYADKKPDDKDINLAEILYVAPTNEILFQIQCNIAEFILKKDVDILSDNAFLDIPWEYEITKFDMDNSSCPYQIYPFKSITCC